MSRESRRLAGVLLVVLPTVMYGGVALLTALIHDPQYMLVIGVVTLGVGLLRGPQ